MSKWGRETQKIVELCIKAGHPESEFVEQAGAVGVRFLPSSYMAPHSVAHDLTSRQRQILQVLAGRELPLREIIKGLTSPPTSATARDDLYDLKRLGLIELKGRSRGAIWALAIPDE